MKDEISKEKTKWFTAAAAVLVWLTAANFIYQAATQRQWETAIERSYFQAVALLALAIVVRLKQ